MWRTLSSAADAEEARYYSERSRRWNDNSVAVWKNFDALSTDDIVASDVSPETKRSALLMKRSDAQSGKSVIDDPGAKQQIYEMIAEMSEGRERHANVTKVIAGHAESGDISYETAVQLQQAALTYSDKVFAGATFNEIAKAGFDTITRGVPSEELINIFAEKKGAELAALANEWKTALIEKKIYEGPNFDPRAFYVDNIASFRTRAELIQAGDEKLNLQTMKQKFAQAGNKIDKTAIMDYMKDHPDLYPTEEYNKNMNAMRDW